MRFLHLVNVALWFANAFMWLAVSPNTHFGLFWAVVALGDLFVVRYKDKERLWARHY